VDGEEDPPGVGLLAVAGEEDEVGPGALYQGQEAAGGRHPARRLSETAQKLCITINHHLS